MADLKTLLGDEYKENMTVEEITEALKDKTFVNPLTLPKSVDKKVFDKTASELAAAKKKLKEKMSDDEAKKEEQDTIAEQLRELQKENSQMKLKENFLSNGYDAKTASNLAQAYSEGDMSKFAKLNADFMTSKEKTLQAKIKEDLLKGTQGINGGSSNSEVDFSKKIEEARARGDMPAVASLIRQQAETQSKGE